jgi:hypothetical protein
MAKASQFEHLRIGLETERKARETEGRVETLTAALANATVDMQALERALEDAQTRAERAEREARSLRRDLARADATRNEEVERQVRAVAKGMELDGLRRRAETFDQVTETLRGNPGAQQLARLIVNAGRKAQGQPGVFIAREGTTPEQAAFALQVANAQRRARGLPLLKAAGDDQPGDNDKEDVDTGPVDEDDKPRKAKKKKAPVTAEDEDPSAEDDEDAKAIDGTKDPEAFARAVAAVSKKLRGR